MSDAAVTLSASLDMLNARDSYLVFTVMAAFVESSTDRSNLSEDQFSSPLSAVESEVTVIASRYDF